MNKSLNLINELIEIAQKRDEVIKSLFLAVNRGELCVGEDIMVTYLRNLKELITEEFNTINGQNTSN